MGYFNSITINYSFVVVVNIKVKEGEEERMAKGRERSFQFPSLRKIVPNCTKNSKTSPESEEHNYGFKKRLCGVGSENTSTQGR